MRYIDNGHVKMYKKRLTPSDVCLEVATGRVLVRRPNGTWAVAPTKGVFEPAKLRLDAHATHA